MSQFNLRNFLTENKLTSSSKKLDELKTTTSGTSSVYKKFRKEVEDENISSQHPMVMILNHAKKLYDENDETWDGMFTSIDDALVFAAEDFMEAYRDDEDVQEVAKYIIRSIEGF